MAVKSLRTRLIRRISDLALLAALSAFAAECDTLSEPEACPTVSGKEEASYFPNDPGTEWHYDYRRYASDMWSPYTTTTTGVMTWRITSREDACDWMRFHLTESFAGETTRTLMGAYDTTFAQSWEQERIGWFDGDQIRIEGVVQGSSSDFVGSGDKAWGTVILTAGSQ